MIHIREEQKNDIEAVDKINNLAFERTDEADLVRKIRANDKVILSLVALQDGLIVGHILFTPMRLIADEGSERTAVGLGPLAVLPRYQGQGIGSALIKEGLAHCRKKGHDLVFVLGYPAYYPRFGFQPAHEFNIRCAYEVPDEAFMVCQLDEGSAAAYGGVMHYEPEFDGV